MFALQPLANFGTGPLLLLLLIFAIICVLLILVILMQKGKGEGLAGLVGGVSASDNMGTPEAQKELSAYTRNFAIIFFMLCIILSVVSTRCGAPVETTLPFDNLTPAEQAAPDNTVQDLEETPDMTTEDAATSPEVEFALVTQEAVEMIDTVVDEVSPEAL